MSEKIKPFGDDGPEITVHGRNERGYLTVTLPELGWSGSPTFLQDLLASHQAATAADEKEK